MYRTTAEIKKVAKLHSKTKGQQKVDEQITLSDEIRGLFNKYGVMLSFNKYKIHIISNVLMSGNIKCNCVTISYLISKLMLI